MNFEQRDQIKFLEGRKKLSKLRVCGGDRMSDVTTLLKENIALKKEVELLNRSRRIFSDDLYTETCGRCDYEFDNNNSSCQVCDYAYNKENKPEMKKKGNGK